MEPGSQGIVRLAHPYQLGNHEILRKPTSITIIAEFLPNVKALTHSTQAGCPVFAPVASDCPRARALYHCRQIDPVLTICESLLEVLARFVVATTRTRNRTRIKEAISGVEKPDNKNCQENNHFDNIPEIRFFHSGGILPCDNHWSNHFFGISPFKSFGNFHTSSE